MLNDHLSETDEIVERLSPFDVICVIRERTSLRSVLDCKLRYHFSKTGKARQYLSPQPQPLPRRPSFRECSLSANTATPLSMLAQRGVSFNLASPAQKGGNQNHEWATQR